MENDDTKMLKLTKLLKQEANEAQLPWYNTILCWCFRHDVLGVLKLDLKLTNYYI